MAILKLVITLLLFLSVVFAMRKKMNAGLVLTVVGVIGIALGIIINGTTPMGPDSTGFWLFDIFEYFKSSGIIGTISGSGINILCICAYVAYMNYLNASTMFALLVSKPIVKIKKKSILIFSVYVLSALLYLVIPNGTGRIALLMGTIYPIMLICGVSKATGAACIFSGTMHAFGPANSVVIMAANFAGIQDFNCGQFFISVEFPWSFLSMLAGGLIFTITAKFFDKKENAEGGTEKTSGITPESLGVPKYYALFPILPLVVIVTFSGMITGLPILSIPAAELLCFIFVFAFLVIKAKDKLTVFNQGAEFFNAMGTTLATIVSIIFGATMFGAAITQIGGITILLQPFFNAGADISLPMFIIATIIIGLIIGTVAVNAFVVYPILAPLYAAIAASSGANLNYMILALANSVIHVMGFSPATAHVALSSGTSGVDILTIIKRNIPSAAASIAMYILIACIMA